MTEPRRIFTRCNISQDTLLLIKSHGCWSYTRRGNMVLASLLNTCRVRRWAITQYYILEVEEIIKIQISLKAGGSLLGRSTVRCAHLIKIFHRRRSFRRKGLPNHEGHSKGQIDKLTKAGPSGPSTALRPYQRHAWFKDTVLSYGGKYPNSCPDTLFETHSCASPSLKDWR